MRLVVLLVGSILGLCCSLKWLPRSGRNLNQHVTSSVRGIPERPIMMMTTQIGDFGTKGGLPPKPPSNDFIYWSGKPGGNRGTSIVALANTNTTSTHSDNTSSTLQNSISQHITDGLKQLLQALLGIILLFYTAIGKQLSELVASAPFLAERLSQYINPPLAILLSIEGVRRIRNITYLRNVLLVSISLGAILMLYDSIQICDVWRTMQPAMDGYAIVTGAGDGLGKLLAQTLYAHGHNIVLVDSDKEAMQNIREELLFKNISIVQSGVLVKDKALKPNSNAGVSNKSPIQQSVVPRGYCANFLRDGFRGAKSYLKQSSNGKSNQQQLIAYENPKELVPSLPSLRRLLNFLRYWDKNRNVSVTSLEKKGISAENERTKGKLLGSKVHDDFECIWQPSIHTVHADFTDVNAAQSVYNELQKLNITNKVDVLVNAAEFRSPLSLSFTSKQCEDSLLNHFRDELQVNALFPASFTQLLIPSMIERVQTGRKGWLKSIGQGIFLKKKSEQGPKRVGGGRVLFVTSDCSGGPSPSTESFSASKAYISSLSKSLRRKLISRGVLVTLANVGSLLDDSSVPFTSQHEKLKLNSGDGVSGTLHIQPGEDGILIKDNLCTSSPVFTPILHKLPGCCVRADKAAAHIYSALSTGRDTITPGTVQKAYRHSLMRVLSEPVVSVIHQVIWKPAPWWTEADGWRNIYFQRVGYLTRAQQSSMKAIGCVYSSFLNWNLQSLNMLSPQFNAQDYQLLGHANSSIMPLRLKNIFV